jgi:hypothetical protein
MSACVPCSLIVPFSFGHCVCALEKVVVVEEFVNLCGNLWEDYACFGGVGRSNLICHSVSQNNIIGLYHYWQLCNRAIFHRVKDPLRK